MSFKISCCKNFSALRYKFLPRRASNKCALSGSVFVLTLKKIAVYKRPVIDIPHKVHLGGREVYGHPMQSYI